MASDNLALTRQNRSSAMTSSPNKAVRQQIPAFLNKLYSMVNDPANSELIRWSGDGDSFFVPNHERFGRELLPRFFKHQNFSSFVRQLNMYGFHKVPHLQQGVLQNETETELWQFANPHFQRGQPDLLMLIQRKKAGVPAAPDAPDEDDLDGPDAHGAGAMDLSTVAQSLGAIKRHQASISSDLKDLQQSNTALWQEAVAARERHKKHQDTINRILKFLAGVFGSAANSAGASSGIVQDHEEGSTQDGGSHSPAALVPRKRPRLMIEGSSPAGQVARNAVKGKEKHTSGRGTIVEDDDEWERDHPTQPMDVVAQEPGLSNSGHISEVRSPGGDQSSLWGDDTRPLGRIESVASTPSTAMPPTPYIAPTNLQNARPPTSNLALPSKPRHISAPNIPTPTGNEAVQSQQLLQGLGSMQTQDSSLPSSLFSAAAGVTPVAPATYDLNTSDQAVLQAILSAPGGTQRVLAALSQPGGLPLAPLPPMANLPPHMLMPPYPNYPAAGSQPHFQFSATGLNDGTQNQLIPAWNAAPPAVHNSTFPPMPPGVNNASISPEAMLSLLQGPTSSGAAGMQLMGPEDQQIWNGLNAQTSAINKTYGDQAAIDADVEHLEHSLDSFMQSIGLDPAVLANYQTADSNALATNVQPSHPSMDIDALLNNNWHDGSQPLDTSQGSDTAGFAFNGNTSFQGMRQEQSPTPSTSSTQDSNPGVDDTDESRSKVGRANRKSDASSGKRRSIRRK